MPSVTGGTEIGTSTASRIAVLSAMECRGICTSTARRAPGQGGRGAGSGRGRAQEYSILDRVTTVCGCEPRCSRRGSHGGSGLNPVSCSALLHSVIAQCNMAQLSVAISDFPTYDGSQPPDDFLRQCTRLAELGGHSDETVAKIIAARCRGRALTVVNGIEDNGGMLDLTAIKTSLVSHFGGATKSTGQAAQALAALTKGGRSTQEYALAVRRLVRQACPEFFAEDGQLKKICVPSYNATLYRHFLVGLSDEDKRLLSRQKAVTFEDCVSELTREEELQQSEVASTLADRHVRWAGPDNPRPGRPQCDGRSSTPDQRRGRWRSSAGRLEDDSSSDEYQSGEDRGPTPYRRGRGHSPSPGPGGSSPSGRRPSWTWSRAAGAAADGRRRWLSGRAGGDTRGRRQPPQLGGRTGTGRHVSPAGRPGGGGSPGGGGGGSPGRSGGVNRGSPESHPRRDGSPNGDFDIEGRHSGIVRCWSCGGTGHMKRHCPNEWAGRRAW